ncbi:NAD(P)-dependent dehydrogenase (short-subunit alcohol dehydrogenase family) [Bradyrhizobium sp. I1.8.5]
MFETGLLRDKRILVTGGGSGLGAAMGRRFLALGAELVICGRKLDRLEATASEMRAQTGGKVTTIACDVRDGGAVESMMDAIWREAPLDILVNNAAATFIAQSEHLSFRAADAILAPTLHGAMYCTLAAGKRWIDGKHGGVVLSILSTSTITGRAFTVPSAMAKSAVLAMTRSLAVEWGPKGIRTPRARSRPLAPRGSSVLRAATKAGPPGTRWGVPASTVSSPTSPASWSRTVPVTSMARWS